MRLQRVKGAFLWSNTAEGGGETLSPRGKPFILSAFLKEECCKNPSDQVSLQDKQPDHHAILDRSIWETGMTSLHKETLPRNPPFRAGQPSRGWLFLSCVPGLVCERDRGRQSEGWRRKNEGHEAARPASSWTDTPISWGCSSAVGRWLRHQALGWIPSTTVNQQRKECVF